MLGLSEKVKHALTRGAAWQMGQPADLRDDRKEREGMRCIAVFKANKVDFRHQSSVNANVIAQKSRGISRLLRAVFGTQAIPRQRSILRKRLSDPDAFEQHIVIAWIVDPANVHRSQKSTDVVAAGIKQWTDDPDLAAEKHRCRDAGPCFCRPSLSHRQRFGLIVGCMRGDNEIAALALSEIGKQLVTFRAGRRLQAGRRLWAGPIQNKMLDPQSLAECVNASCLFSRTGTQAVIDSGGDQFDAGLSHDGLPECNEQASRIAAARNGDKHPAWIFEICDKTLNHSRQ
jgi:hypothetical protein